jgi:hypothetical protein
MTRTERVLEGIDEGYFEAFAIMIKDDDGEWGLWEAAGQREELEGEYERLRDNCEDARIVKVAVVSLEPEE